MVIVRILSEFPHHHNTVPGTVRYSTPKHLQIIDGTNLFSRSRRQVGGVWGVFM